MIKGFYIMITGIFITLSVLALLWLLSLWGSSVG